jgi:hypothetical protein
MVEEETQINESEMYFAARSPEKTAGVLLGKAQTFFNTLNSNSYIQKLKDMYRFYYGHFSGDGSDSHEITFTGEQGELVRLPVNHFRNLARHMYNMITASRPTLEARAVNSDYKSLSQTYLANGILDYYMREKGLEDMFYEAVEMSVVLGAAYLKMEWNATAGETYDVDPETGEPVNEGELEFSILSPLDVVVDGTKENWHSQEWVLTRTFANRHNLAAKYPEMAEKILKMETKSDINKYRISLFTNDDTDDIAVYEFFHKKSDAIPEGRYLLFLSDDVVLLDLPMPYRTIPVFDLCPSRIMGTPYGYTDMFDVYPLQEAMNSMYSAVMTNQNAFNVQNLFVQRGADLSVSSLAGGMNVVEGNAKPEPLQLTSTAPETFNFLNLLINSSEMLTGVSSVTRGQPEASLRSASALALVQSMSLQFVSGFQKNYVKFLERTGTSLIEILKDFAQTPKLIALVGKNKQPYLKEFTGDMIKDVKRVVVDVGNPLARTTAGRVQMAEQLAQMNLLKNPQQYFMVIETGRIDTLMEGEMSELLLIKRENEMMLEGKEVFAALLDKHRLHIMEHQAVISDPELRSNPELLAQVQAHIQEHIDILRSADPDLLQLIGEQPLQPQGQPQQTPPMPGPEGEMSPQPVPGGAGSPEEMIQPSGDISQVMDQIQEPRDASVDAALLPDPSIDPRAQ